MVKHIIVLTTVPDEKKGREIAKAVVKARLAACATLSLACQSFYWWEGKIAQDREFILLIKTRANLYPKLQTKIKSLHPYTIPEIIALPIVKGSTKYLDWLEKETKGSIG